MATIGDVPGPAGPSGPGDMVLHAPPAATDGTAAGGGPAETDEGPGEVGADGAHERPYLSIGEVLELLKTDFEGVSIAQVRELESRGLFTAERTASGYRKFYDADLGLIRSLLDRHGSTLSRPVRRRGSGTPLPETPPAHPALAGPTARGSAGRSARVRPGDADPDDDHGRVGSDEQLPGEPERRHPAAAARRARAEAALASLASGSMAGTSGSEAGPGAGSGGGSALGAPASGSAGAAERRGGGVPAVGSSGASDDEQDATRAGRTRGLALVRPAPSTGPANGAQVPADGSGGRAADPEVRAGLRSLAGGASGVSLSIGELATASGLTIEQVHELESQGLVRGRTVFSESFYDEDALLVAHLARRFLSFGLEPRHLRMFRLTAEREAAFYEQLVTPLLRRRGTEAHEQALGALDEMLEIGQQLRAVTVRQVLRAAIER